MRIEINIYKDYSDDNEYDTPDYTLSSPTIDMAIEKLGALERAMEKRNTVSEDNPFKEWQDIDREASRTHSNLPPGYKEDEL